MICCELPDPSKESVGAFRVGSLDIISMHQENFPSVPKVRGCFVYNLEICGLLQQSVLLKPLLLLSLHPS